MLSALSLPGVSLLPFTVSAEKADSTRIIAVSENICRDTRTFAGHLPVSLIEPDPASMMLHIASGFENQDFHIAYGLTRDSNMMLIEQYALQHGYRLEYHGVHSYCNHHLHHEITAGAELLGSLSGQLADESSDWVAGISRVPAYSNRGNQVRASRVIKTNHIKPAGASGQLVSWMFSRESA